MRALSLRLARVLAITLLAVVVLVLGVSKLIHGLWNHERLGRSISRWASKHMLGAGGPTHEGFTFGRVGYAWLPALRSPVGGAPLRVEVWDVHIWDPDGKEVLRAPHTSVGLQLGRLVRAQVWGYLPFTRPDLELALEDAVVDEVHCHNKECIARFAELFAQRRRAGRERAVTRPAAWSLGAFTPR